MTGVLTCALPSYSLSGGATSLVGWLSFRLAGKPADEDHHYGHGKAEALAAALVGLVLLVAGVLLVSAIILGVFPNLVFQYMVPSIEKLTDGMAGRIAGGF